jgi:hypothetical protein
VGERVDVDERPDVGVDERVDVDERPDVGVDERVDVGVASRCSPGHGCPELPSWAGRIAEAAVC